MSKVKLAALLLISFVATASVIYQLKNRKAPIAPGVAADHAGAASAGPAPRPPAVTSVTSALPADVTVAHPGGPPPNIPSTGWRRNPFLTIEEEDRLKHPDLPVAEVQPPPKPAEALNLPSYVVTGIISGRAGNWAIINDRWSLREGSRLGSEVVKEVKDHSVVLDHEGHLRELPLKSLEETAAAAAPKAVAAPKKEEK